MKAHRSYTFAATRAATPLPVKRHAGNAYSPTHRTRGFPGFVPTPRSTAKRAFPSHKALVVTSTKRALR